MEFLSLSEAIRRHVRDGDTLALEGFTHLIPFAAGHEIIRQRRRNLTLVRMTPDLIYDQMIGMGVARRLVFSWGGNPGVGSLHRMRDAIERDWPSPLEIVEHAMPGWLWRTKPALRACPVPSCAGTADRIWPRAAT
jgi:glutaconate CoA-transferase subunit A